MKRLIVVTGDIAAGKSTYSDMLSQTYQVSVFHKDTIKEILGEHIGFRDREENLKLSRATVGLMTFLFEEFAKLGKPLILEANFHREELAELLETAKRYEYEVMTLNLQGDMRILYERYVKRMEHRHAVHLRTSLDIYENFQEYVEAARAEGTVGTVLEVHADDFSYQQDEVLMAKIGQFLRGE